MVCHSILHIRIVGQAEEKPRCADELLYFSVDRSRSNGQSSAYLPISSRMYQHELQNISRRMLYSRLCDTVSGSPSRERTMASLLSTASWRVHRDVNQGSCMSKSRAEDICCKLGIKDRFCRSERVSSSHPDMMLLRSKMMSKKVCIQDVFCGARIIASDFEWYGHLI
jgi:hypothetical protein